MIKSIIAAIIEGILGFLSKEKKENALEERKNRIADPTGKPLTNFRERMRNAKAKRDL